MQFFPSLFFRYIQHVGLLFPVFGMQVFPEQDLNCQWTKEVFSFLKKNEKEQLKFNKRCLKKVYAKYQAVWDKVFSKYFFLFS
jgi:hypothetical protein